MKFLVVGLGSMGKKRIRNLISLGYDEIVGVDIRQDRLNEAKKNYGIETFSSFDHALLTKPDMIIISTSPDKHLKYVELSTKNKIPFFTEVNTEPMHIKKIISFIKKQKVMGVSSLTMRFHPAIKIIKEYVDKNRLGKIYFLNYHSGERLEDWHPSEDVRDYYVKSIRTGGGRDQAVFELEWIFWIFGKPKEITAKTAKLSNTKAKIFDTYQMTFTLEKAPLANVLVDVVQRPPNRIFRAVFENGIISWDWLSGFVRIYDARTKKWEEFSHGQGYKGFNVEEMYQEEIKEAIQSIVCKKILVSTFEHELMSANAVIIAEKSSKKRSTLYI